MIVIDARATIQALGLPKSCRVDQRVPKKLLLENGAPTAADKRLITHAIEDIHWIAAIKPNTSGVPAYRDAQREYLEIAVLTLNLRGANGRRAYSPANFPRLAELVHRAIPYPLLLLLIEEQGLAMSLAHKRWAQNEAAKVVLDGGLVSATLNDEAGRDFDGSAEAKLAFMQSLSVTRQPQTTLLALYQGWIDCVQALLAARLTGSYRTTTSPGQAAVRRQALIDCERLEAEIRRLRAQAAKEKQLARQVELNLTLKRVEVELTAARQQL